VLQNPGDFEKRFEKSVASYGKARKFKIVCMYTFQTSRNVAEQQNNTKAFLFSRYEINKSVHPFVFSKEFLKDFDKWTLIKHK